METRGSATVASVSSRCARIKARLTMRVKINVVVLSISDKAAAGETTDRSGPALIEELMKLPSDIHIVATETLSRDLIGITERLRFYADRGDVHLIATTGGTGLAPRDHTPEATQSVIQREVPGFVEAMRFSSFSKTPLAPLSRAVCRVRGGTLFINFPGSVRGVQENFDAIRKALPHAIGTLSEQTGKCASWSEPAAPPWYKPSA